eukprot:4003699-Lingulodinium_polyedra.AAC.1
MDVETNAVWTPALNQLFDNSCKSMERAQLHLFMFTQAQLEINSSLDDVDINIERIVWHSSE